MKCYVVQGYAGEYDDYREWIVGAFLSETKAKKFRDECSANPFELDENATRMDENKYTVFPLDIDEEME